MQIIGERLKELILSRENWNNASEGICINTPRDDFKPDVQITDDAVDLRISDKGYIMNKSYKYINTLSQKTFDAHFKEVPLGLDGYILKPGEILYIGTLEQISLKGSLIGRVTGRSTYSRLGLSISSSQDKFCGYNNAIVSLQLRNNSNQSLKIYPYQKLVQILFYRTEGSPIQPGSPYANESEYRLPQVAASERYQYDSNTAEKIAKSPSKKHNVVNRGIAKVKNTKGGIKLMNIMLGVIGTFGTAIIGISSLTTVNKIIVSSVLLIIYLVFSVVLNICIDSEDSDS
ncbi:MAG: hypothetical protein Q4B92_02745 [Ruminococcus sp.]|nr:hypothetical protein [Ruminococcus sp.]